MPYEIAVTSLNNILQQFKATLFFFIILRQWDPVIYKQIDKLSLIFTIFFRRKFPLEKVLLISVDRVYCKIC